jgi:CRP/FNR family transcriptional regulator
MNNIIEYHWVKEFPMLAMIKGPTWDTLQNNVSIVEVPTGETIYHVGDSCENYLLVLTGSVRVQMFFENGHEIVLYRVEQGQSCIMTTSCLLARESYQAEAVTETPAKAVIIPVAEFEQALAKLAPFRQFVFTAYAKRITDLMCLINDIAFERMDVRLARFLLQQPENQRELHMTHQHIANELGTAREVISRLLKEFEHRGIIETHRGYLTINNPKTLQQISQL